VIALSDVQPLTPADLPGCLAVAVDRDWPPEAYKWRLLLDVGTGWGVRDADGTIVGTTILTRYGTDLAVLSMVLVAHRCAGQGVGRRLVEHALAAAGPACVVLNATACGLPLYRKLGFADAGLTSMHFGVPRFPAAPVRTRVATAADLPSIRALDARVQGADRSAVLSRLPGFADELRVLETGGVVTGFGAVRPGYEVAVVGPLVAADEAGARALLTDLLRGVTGRVRVDLSERHPRLRDWVARHGLSDVSVSPYLAWQGPVPGARAGWFSPLMQSLG
jgi:GNAT superfamily N-acetyltransferase